MLVLTAAAGGCRSASPEPAAPSTRSDFLITARRDEEISVPPGATVELRDANLRIRLATLDDSRCPTGGGVQCVWAGTVRVQLLVGPLSGAQPSTAVTLDTRSEHDVVVLLGHSIRLVRVEPERKTTDPIPAESYRVVLRVTTAR